MRICVIGAGALGGCFGGRLAKAGFEVSLIDTWKEHVEAIRRDGLLVRGVPGEFRVRVPAATGPEGVAPVDLALVAVDANHTAEAARTAAAVLAPDGVALTVQNGIGNIEALVAALGSARVLGGSTMASFQGDGPGRVTQTHAAPTTIGELDRRTTPRVERVRDALQAAGFETRIAPDIMAVIWEKFLLNLAINPICAVTFLRLGELVRLDATDRFQDRIIDEACAVVRAKGLALDLDAIRTRIKRHCRSKYSKPSMLQHLERGVRTEIDALNGALVREAAALGLDVPFNEALTLLVKGAEAYHRRRVHGPALDEAALEAAAAAEAGAPASPCPGRPGCSPPCCSRSSSRAPRSRGRRTASPSSSATATMRATCPTPATPPATRGWSAATSWTGSATRPRTSRWSRTRPAPRSAPPSARPTPRAASRAAA